MTQKHQQKNNQYSGQVSVISLTVAIGLATVLGCAHTAEKPKSELATSAPAATASPTKAESAKASERSVINPDPSLVDVAIDPCTDYFQYACGTWLKTTEIPSDRPSWGRGFGVLDEQNQLTLKGVLEHYSAGQFEPANPYAKQLGDFYGSCMDTAKLEDGSMKTLAAELARIDALNETNLAATLPEWIAHMRLSGVRVLFSMSETPDNKDPEKVIGELHQGGFGLPTRDYYHSDKQQMKDVRAQYVKYVAKMLELSGEAATQAATDAEAVLKFETKLTEQAKLPADLRDPTKTYHPTAVADLSKEAPALAWPAFFKSLDLATMKTVNVTVPEFLSGMNDTLKSEPLPELKAYLKFQLLNGVSKGLPDRFYNETFGFYAKTLSGYKEIPARWKLCVQATNEMMGFAIARSYVALTFAGESKAIAKKLIESIEKTEKKEIDRLAWMDAPTKKQAHLKLSRLVNHVGYPDVWRSYDGLGIDRASYLSNRLNAAAFNTHYSLNKIGKPLDRKDWGMVPSAVNAYYDPQQDKMVFPAGILQPPFFNANYEPQANYGGIGMVMGHEMSHGFDDQGRQFDAYGRQRDWWSKTSAKEFEKRASCLEKQYDSFPIAGGGHVNGKLTLGEDIGDQGGITLAYAAWKASLPAKIAKDPAQVRELGKAFFMSFAQTWCAKDTEAYEKLRANIDPHPPARYRVNGPLSDLPAFAETYQCKAGAALAPVERCIVW